MKGSWERLDRELAGDEGEAGLAHWILVSPTLADDALEAAGRAALAARGKELHDGDELIFQDFGGMKEPAWLMTEPLEAARARCARLKART